MKSKIHNGYGKYCGKIYAAALKMGFCNISIEDTLKACVEKLSALNDIKNVLLSPSAAADRYSNMPRGATPSKV